MNSDPESESRPFMGKGIRVLIDSTASSTLFSERLRKASFSVHPSTTSVMVIVCRYSPEVLLSQWWTRSISQKPGSSSGHSLQVLIGIWLFSIDPGLVMHRPMGKNDLRFALSNRSHVEGLSLSSLSLVCSFQSDSLWLLSQWWTRSISQKPGSSSGHSLQVLIGIWSE